MKIPSPVTMFLMIGFVSAGVYFGILWNLDFLKYIAALSEIYIFLISFFIIYRYKTYINWQYAFFILFFIFLYPFLRIVIISLKSFDIKMIIDGLIAKGGYYQLPLVGLAISLLIIKNNFKINDILYKLSFILLPVGVIFSFLGIFIQAQEGHVGIVYLVYVTCFIPVALLSISPSNKIQLYLGWISIFLIFYFSALQDSRSYTLVAVYLSFAALNSLYKKNKKLFFSLILLIIVFYFMGSFSFFIHNHLNDKESVVGKFKFHSLLEALNMSFSTGNFSYLFFWKGNSRASILIDAFGNFNLLDFLFGKGIFGTYLAHFSHGFLERTTIELGWAQELFYWGSIYVISLFIAMLYANRYIKKNKKLLFKNSIYPILNSLIIINILDAFVYGMPEYSIYNALVFTGIMMPAIKKRIIWSRLK